MTTNTPADSRRAITLTRTELGRYVLRNERGLEFEFGHGDDLFTPVELLLAAIGGCSAIDVDHITAKRAEPDAFEVEVSGDKITDEAGGHRMSDLVVDFRVTFPDTDEGCQAAAVVARSAGQSRDRLCTVSRTVSQGTEVAYRVDGEPI